MAFNFTLIVQEDRPSSYAPGTYWLKPSQGLLTIYFSEDHWHYIATGKGNLTTPSDGVYYKTLIETTDLDTLSPVNGDMALQNTDTLWAYIGQWCPVGGN